MNYLAQIDIGDKFFNGSNNLDSIAGVPLLATLILRASFVFASLILLFYFIMGGIGMIGSAGKNDPQKAEMAKKSITTAVIGFVVVFMAYWIVKLLGEILGVDNLI